MGGQVSEVLTIGIEIRECEAKDFPSLDYLPHWRNAGSFSWPDLGMLDTILKGEMCREDVGFIGRG